MEKFHQTVRSIGIHFGKVSGLCVCAMALLIAADVTLRFTVNTAILGTYEIVQILMCMTVASAFAYTQAKEGHVNITMFVEYLPKRGQQVLKAVCLTVATVVILMVAYGSLMEGINVAGHHLQTSVLYIPLYPFYYFLSLGFLYFGLLLLADTIYNFWLLSQPLPAEKTTGLNIGSD